MHISLCNEFKIRISSSNFIGLSFQHTIFCVLDFTLPLSSAHCCQSKWYVNRKRKKKYNWKTKIASQSILVEIINLCCLSCTCAKKKNTAHSMCIIQQYTYTLHIDFIFCSNFWYYRANEYLSNLGYFDPDQTVCALPYANMGESPLCTRKIVIQFAKFRKYTLGRSLIFFSYISMNDTHKWFFF